MVSVRLENLTKYFGKVRAIEDVNLKVKDGEFMTLLGPSGCGKTTTLRCIAGLETPTSGYIYFDDKIVNELSPKERNVAMVFQSYALYPHMKVFDNLAFPLKIRKLPRDEINRKVREVAELLRIEELLDRKPSELSGGQQQRVALGRALVREPVVFLMDEPLSNLDAKLRVYMRAELKALQKSLGITTIFVTHDQIEAMTMSDRIALLNEGILQQVGTPEELYGRPANIFVAGFIGTPPMNIAEGSLIEKDTKVYIDTGSFTLDLTEFRDILTPYLERDVILGIRPENISIKDTPTGEAVEAKVYLVEPLGGKAIVDLHVGSSASVLFKVEAAEALWKPGETVWILLDKKKLHLFDKKTGKAIM